MGSNIAQSPAAGAYGNNNQVNNNQGTAAAPQQQQKPGAKPVPVVRFHSHGRDSFEMTPSPHAARCASPKAQAYCNYPAGEAVAKDELPHHVLVKAAQTRFDDFNPKTFGNTVTADKLPHEVARLFAANAGGPGKKSLHFIRVAGERVYALSREEPSGVYLLLSDRQGKPLGKGFCPRSTGGTFQPAYWRDQD
jgi:hypothetical protein